MKLLIVGIVASGKTTLAKRLSKEYDIKYYEIDKIVYDRENNKRNVLDQNEIVKFILNQNDWIIEGVLRKNLYYLLDEASQIIYIDIPIQIRKRRIFIRYIKQKLHIEKSDYKPNLEMLKMMYKWTDKYEVEKTDFEKVLNKYNKKIIKLNTVNEIKKIKL